MKLFTFFICLYFSPLFNNFAICSQVSCIVTAISGSDMTCYNESQIFIVNKGKKLLSGNIIYIHQDSEIKLLYFTGNVEHWRGPVWLMIMSNFSKNCINEITPKITILPSMNYTLKNSKILNSQDTIVTGHIVLRQSKQLHKNFISNQHDQESIIQAEKEYVIQKKTMTEGDITADIAYIAKLEACGQNKLLLQHIEDLYTNNPGNTEIMKLYQFILNSN